MAKAKIVKPEPITTSYPPTPLAEDQARRTLREQVQRSGGRNGTILDDARDAAEQVGSAIARVVSGARTITRSTRP